MKVFLKNLFSCSVFTLVLLMLLHPRALLAMDPKVTEEEAEEIVGGVKKYFGIEQKSIQTSNDASICLQKADEAFKQGNESVGNIHLKASAQYQLSAEYAQRAAEAGAAGNTQEKIHFNGIGDSARYSAYRLNKAASDLEQAIIATKDGNQALSDSYLKASTQYQVSAEYFQKAVEAGIARNEQEKINCDKAGYSFRWSADQLSDAASALGQASKAIASGNQVLGDSYLKASSQYQLSAVCYEKAAEAGAIGNLVEQANLDQSALFMMHSATQLNSAASVLEQSTAIANANQPIYNLYHPIIFQHQLLAEYYQRAAEMGATENLGPIFDQANTSAWNSTIQLNSAVNFLEQATQAIPTGSKTLSESYINVALESQLSAEHYQKAAEAYAQGNKSAGDYFNQAGLSSESKGSVPGF